MLLVVQIHKKLVDIDSTPVKERTLARMMMDNDVNQRRAAVFGIIYMCSMEFYSKWVPRPLRWVFEILILLAAFLTLCVWGYVHNTYILHPMDCLGPVSERPFPRDMILQVEVYSNHTYLWEKRNAALQDLYQTISRRTLSEHFQELKLKNDTLNETLSDGEFLEDKEWGTEYCNYSLLDLVGMQPLCKTLVHFIEERVKGHKDDLTEQTMEEGPDIISTTNVTTEDDNLGLVDNITDGVVVDKVDVNEGNSPTEEGTPPVDDGDSPVGEDQELADLEEIWREESMASFFAENRTLYELFDFYSLKLLALDYSLLEFTRETGYLSLTSSTRARLNISVVKIYIDPDETDCFGGSFGIFLTKFFLGYDMMIISSFKNLLPEKIGSGYVKDLLTGSHYYYKVQWMGKWRYMAGLLPAMFFTLVASVLLRQVHYHVFKFLTHFRNLLNQGIPMPVQTGAQIPFLIVTYAAIGLIIVMSEALSDDSMFSVLMVTTVWEVDQFYAIYCRQQTSKMYFPWFFFLYHFLPYAYFVRFNGQFWFLPFLFHWLMTQHAMLFFINHCELPGERIRIQIFRVPRPPDQIPPGVQPDLNPPNNPPVVRINVQFGGQQPNVDNPDGQVINNNNPPGPNEVRIHRDGTNSVVIRRRGVGVVSQDGGGATPGNESAALAEEVSHEGASELVSGSSRRFLLNQDAQRHEIHTRDHFGERENVIPFSNTSELMSESQGGVLSRESIRAARLNRFQRTSLDDSDVDVTNHIHA